MEDWDGSGRNPLFGHQIDWIRDTLETFGCTDIAVLAQGSRDDSRGARYFLVCQLGVMVATLTPDAQGQPLLESTLVTWSDVEGIDLRARTDLDDALRRRMRWRLSVRHPRLTMEDEGANSPLVDFWRECVTRIGRPATIEPKDPD
jgi:hypothetical protein